MTPPGSSPALRQAAYANQRAWVRRVGAIDAAGRPRAVHESGDTIAVRTGTSAAIMTPGTDAAIATLPDALHWLRHEGSGDALIWAELPDRELDRWLSANGAREHFTPRWMTRPLDAPLPDPPPGPAAVRDARAEDLPALLAATELPYISPWQAQATIALATATPDVALVVAELDGRLVGRAALSITRSPLGLTAGIYDAGVDPRWQRRGIGRQLVHRLLKIARARGAVLATLNATPAGERLYDEMGFEDVGEGQTWLLPAETLRHPPAPGLVRFALRISAGEEPGGSPALARRAVPNGDTPLAHAARFDQPESARRLLRMGTIPDLAALWQLGLEREARELMRVYPPALDARRGVQQATPLQIAIYWDDLDFLEALLDAGADPTIRDGVFDSDAWGWCHALGNDDALATLNDRFPDAGR